VNLAATVSTDRDVKGRTNRSLGTLRAFELDHSRSARAAARLVLDLGSLDGSDGREEIDEVLVAGGPRQVLDEDDGAHLAVGACVVSELVRGLATARAAVEPAACAEPASASAEPASAVATATSSESTATAEAATEAASASASGIATATSSESTATAEAAAEAATARGAGEAVLADLNHAAVPLVAVELLDGVAGVVGVVVDDDA
jgi:hypothetical protein